MEIPSPREVKSLFKRLCDEHVSCNNCPVHRFEKTLGDESIHNCGIMLYYAMALGVIKPDGSETMGPENVNRMFGENPSDD